MSGTQGVWVVLPVKRFSAAKTRLAPGLTPDERARLAQLMLEDVLDVVLRCADILAGAAVVTADPDAATLAKIRGAAVVGSPGDTGINAAIHLGIERIGLTGNMGLMVIPSDIPQLSRVAVATASDAIQTPQTMAIVAADDGGTNLLACRPARAVPLKFGRHSFERHCCAARQAGVTAHVLGLPELSVDVDRPADIPAFLALNSRTRTHAFLTAIGASARFARRQDQQPVDCMSGEVQS